MFICRFLHPPPRPIPLPSAAGYGAKTYKEMLEGARRTSADLAAFVELHIEQGPILEQERVQIGIVAAIAAPAALRVRFKGVCKACGCVQGVWVGDEGGFRCPSSPRTVLRPTTSLCWCKWRRACWGAFVQHHPLP